MQLSETPTHRVEIKPSNVKDATKFTKVKPEDNPQYGGGGGREATTPNPIRVDPKKITPLLKR